MPQGLAEGHGITGEKAKVIRELDDTIDKIDKLSVEQNTDIKYVQLDGELNHPYQ